MTTLKRFSSYVEIEGKYEIPDFQRPPMLDKISVMKDHIIERHKLGKEPIFGAIDLVEYNGKLIASDGQHRLIALKLVYEETKFDIPFNAVIYHTTQKEEARLIFNTKNMNTPMPDFYLDNKANINLLKLINEYINTTKGFRSDAKNRPDINTTAFLNALESSKMMTIITSIEHFRIMYNIVNEYFKKRATDSTFIKSNGLDKSKILEKCRETGNYLGIDKNQQKTFAYLDNKDFCEIVYAKIKGRNLPAVQIELKEETKRKRFSNAERQEMWHRYIGADKGQVKCPYCQRNTIDPFHFIAGHVVSLHNGGSNELSNIRPICSVCNDEMGIKDMNLAKYKDIKI
jgi:hypothetical protein